MVAKGTSGWWCMQRRSVVKRCSSFDSMIKIWAGESGEAAWRQFPFEPFQLDLFLVEWAELALIESRDPRQGGW